jgi:hypothetical protein
MKASPSLRYLPTFVTTDVKSEHGVVTASTSSVHYAIFKAIHF